VDHPQLNCKQSKNWLPTSKRLPPFQSSCSSEPLTMTMTSSHSRVSPKPTIKFYSCTSSPNKHVKNTQSPEKSSYSNLSMRKEMISQTNSQLPPSKPSLMPMQIQLSSPSTTKPSMLSSNKEIMPFSYSQMILMPVSKLSTHLPQLLGYLRISKKCK